MMIGHDRVAPNRNIKVADRAKGVLPKSKLGAIQRGNTFAVACRKSDEVEWLIDVNQIKSMRTVLDHSSNCRGSRVGCNNLGSFCGGGRAGSDNLGFAGDTSAIRTDSSQGKPAITESAEPIPLLGNRVFPTARWGTRELVSRVPALSVPI